MQCSNCFHCSVCGSSSPYSDASQCLTYLAKDSVVSIDILHGVQDTCENLRTELRQQKMLYSEVMDALNKNEEEMKYLRIIKQTLEMSSGMKFVI